MKIYCSCCDKVQPVRIDNCRDAKTNEPYQDIVCATCDLVIASGTDIAQPDQEPVAWATRMGEYAHIHWGAKRPEYPMVYEVPLYTSPPASKPLTMQERTSIVRANTSFHDKNEIDAYGIIDDVEVAHGIKGDA